MDLMPQSKDKGYQVDKKKKKQDPSICFLQEAHFRSEETYRLRVRGWTTNYHANECQKKDGVVAILISTNYILKQRL